MGNDPKKVQRNRLVRVCLQDFLIDFFSFGQLPRVMMLYGKVNGLLKG